MLHDGVVFADFLLYALNMVKTGRNAPCPCGSGKKYKHCCIAKEGTSQAPAKPVKEEVVAELHAIMA
jgi:hypothetical protein